MAAHKGIIAVAVVTALGIVGWVHLSPANDRNQVTVSSENTKPPNAGLVAPTRSSPQNTTSISNTRLSDNAEPVSNIGIQDEFVNEYQQDEQPRAEEFNQDIFASVESLDAAFIDPDGAIIMDAFFQVFAYDDFNDLVVNVRQTGSTPESIEYEATLLDQIKHTFAASIYDSRHACSGRICAVTFKSSNFLDDERLANLATFAPTHIFQNHEVNEYGESTFKAVYIVTDTPGEMTVRPSSRSERN